MNENDYWLEMYAAALEERKATDLMVLANQRRVDVANLEYEDALEYARPFMRLGPKMFRDGNSWCCLYGDDIATGVCGWGDSPKAASVDFDLVWEKK